MSGPLSSLKKPHKTPLFMNAGDTERNGEGRQRPVPFRNPNYSDDESKLLDEITGTMATSRIKTRDPFTGGLPKINESNMRSSQGFNMTPRAGGNSLHHHILEDIEDLVQNYYLERSPSDLNSPVPDDRELMSTMISRITQLEARLAYQSKELSEKDKTITVLQEKVKLLQKAQDGNTPSHVTELENKCYLLQNQVQDMESFLQDYGMVWVGVKTPDHSEDEEEEEELWRPETSLSDQPSFKVDYNLLIENIKDLNVLAGEGVASVKHTTGGARLKMPEAVQLTLYANGILMFNGPFRPFTDTATRACVQDIQDGYFPGELQDKYPDGIPFLLTDKREVHYKEKKSSAFSGAGQTLGGETKPSKLVPSRVVDKSTHTTEEGEPDKEQKETTSELPGPQMTVSQFLEKLPKSVVKAGKVIDIRSSIGTTLQAPKSVVKAGKVIDIRSSIGTTLQGREKSQGDVTLIETDTVMEMKKRLEAEEAHRPCTPRDIATLRVKSEDGNHTYILKMKYKDTIGTVRKHLQQHRGPGSPAFDIVSAYPNKVHSDDSVTLQEAGLTPNAVAHLKVRKT